MTGKVMTADEVASELRDGMTIGIGGWGSRRKPMALVRAILRSGVADLTVVSYGGPDVRLLGATGRGRRGVTGFVTPDTVPPVPGRPRLRRAADQPGPAHGPLPLPRRRGADRDAAAAARRRADPPQPCRRAGQRAVPGPRPVLRRPVLPGGGA